MVPYIVSSSPISVRVVDVVDTSTSEDYLDGYLFKVDKVVVSEV